MRYGSSQLTLLRELRPVVEDNLDRHRRFAISWDPADYIDNDRYRWLQRSSLTETAKAALVTSLLAQANDPLHYRPPASVWEERDAWSDWVGMWSAAEAGHAAAIQQYLVVTRSVDPVALEQARLQCTKVGFESPMDGEHLLRSIVQVTLDQMVAVRCHRNTVSPCNDPAAGPLLGRIVEDKQLHVTFLRNVAAAALDIAPERTAKAITEVVMNFQMPGTNLPGFGRSAMLIERDGIYDLRSHLDDVVHPLLASLRLFERTDLGAGGRSRDVLADFVGDLDRAAGASDSTRVGQRAGRLRAS